MAKKNKKDIETPNIDNVINVEKPTATSLPNLPDMYKSWFIDYASYVILDRAVPDIQDGLKPVQRRILHSMKELDDGRYNKVANIIGNTMKYHPHGDQSIGGALVQLGEKDVLIDCQGNWGNILTGDPAAAPRYIEARLSKFANEVIFNSKTTPWKDSYDGRNKEPETLPVKFPLLLLMGVEGIAVGLASKILPHNFNELLDASIKVLKKQPFEIYPDFPTGGLIDVRNYNEGLRGGRLRIRAKVNIIDNKTVVISEIPFSTTTSSLIQSIVAARDKGKIKIKKIDDNTSENVEIVLHLDNGVSPDTTVDALFALKICEISLSPNSCVIADQKPAFLGVSELLKYSVNQTVKLLTQELQIKLAELNDDWHYSSLEKIFFEERIYRQLENDVKTWDDLIVNIDKAFKPFKKLLKKEITREDILKLTEKPVRKISKFDVKKADEYIKGLEKQMLETQHFLDNIIDYAIDYYTQIKKKYGKNYVRKTEIRNFENIDVREVVAANVKLYVNKADGFVGTSLKKDEFVAECSDIDDIIVFRQNGTFKVAKVAEKVFYGNDIIHVAVFRKGDDRTIYNMIYRDGKDGYSYVKRFAVSGVTRDKEYDLTQGKPNSKVFHFSANLNGEAEHIRIFLKNLSNIRRLQYDFDFAEIAIKGRSANGNIITKNPIKKIVIENAGLSTLSARKIWYDNAVNRINADERGTLLGEFQGDDRIVTIMKSGNYKLTNFDLTNHFDEDLISIEKYNPNKIISAIYYDGEQKFFYLKRFKIEESNKKILFIPEENGSYLHSISTDYRPQIKLETISKKGVKSEEIINIEEFIAEKSYKAKGKRLSVDTVKKITWLESLPYEEPTPEPLPDMPTATEVEFDDSDFNGQAIQGELF